MNENVKEILDRVEPLGMALYTWRPGEMDELFNEHNRLIAEGKIKGEPLKDQGCGSCCTAVVQRLFKYRNATKA